MNISDYSTKFFGGDSNLSMYLNDIRKYKVPTHEETIELFKRINNGDDSARDELLIRNQRFIYALAKIYARDESEVLDYVSEGTIGMMEAVDKFDPNMDMKFITYAVWYIRRSMNYYLNNTNNLVRKSNNMKLSKKIMTVKQRYFAENGYYPEDEEVMRLIKKIYGIDVKNKSDVYEMNVSSISDALDDGDYTVEDESEFNQQTASEIIYNTNIENEYNKLLVDEVLNELVKKGDKFKANVDIIKKYYGIGYDRRHTAEEIGDEYNMYEDQVETLIANTIRYLKENKSEYKLAI